jgi:plastocyanin
VTPHRLPALLAVAACAAALAACGSDDKNATTTPVPTPKAAAPAPAAGATTVTMKNIQFDPATVDVKVGGTVKWVNEDTVEHDAVADGWQFKSELFGKGQTFEYKPTKAGSIHYVCTVHPGMEGTLNVTK